MFDWNGNGKVDDGDRAFEAFMIDKMNKEAESGDSYDEFQENDDDEGSEYYLDNEE